VGHANTEITRCPRCDRTVTACNRRYSDHGIVKGSSEQCRMSGQRMPVVGLAEGDFQDRAYLVADLAAQLQDLDPVIVWDYLTALPAAELQRMLMVALAAVPVDGKRVEDLFGWVCALPIAKAAVTA
jgi:hypothetical protein